NVDKKSQILRLVDIDASKLKGVYERMKVESPNKMFEDILFIHQTLSGNQVAFEKLVIKYRPMIFALVASYVKNSADAEDLTQEVFLKAYQNLSSLKDFRQFSFWLKQIARNHCTDWLRRRRENHLSFDEIKLAEIAKVASSAEEVALKQELREIVWQAIDSLLEIDRRLIEARYLENVSLKQLQTDYGLSYCAIAGRLKRAKQKVRQQVQKLLGGFCALPGREILEKLFWGGIEVVKLSLKAKLVTVTTIAVLGFGGASVWHWHFKPEPKNPTVVYQREAKSKKATSAAAENGVVIPKPAPKATSQAQPAKPPAQAKEKQEEISDEEWAELEQWLNEMEQSDEQDEADELAPQVKENMAMYAALREPLEQLHSLYAQLESHYSNERFDEVSKTFHIVDGKIVMDEIFKFLDEKDAIERQILQTAKEAQKIAPNAIEVIESSTVNSSLAPRGSAPHRIRYDIKISRQKLETSWGNIPADIEVSFPGENMFVIIPEDENFSWLEWYRENERKRLAGQDFQNR
ncbi:MAG: RNA polymerase sigma factor, partial [Candidatus Poribacteria bacterium]